MSTAGMLKDDNARREAMTAHDRSMLVEAGAGSGKTAVMAGRIALLLAGGVPPRAIAAVTFTELAASELLERVRAYVHALADSRIPPQLAIALPNGLSDGQRASLSSSLDSFDEMTCTTIHGFCQRLIKPYPAEADIDPGASLVDASQADLMFFETVELWLRERLGGDRSGLLAELIQRQPEQSVALVHQIAESLRRRRQLNSPARAGIAAALAQFERAVGEFERFVQSARALEPDTVSLCRHLGGLIAELSRADLSTPGGLVHLIATPRPRELCTGQGTFLVYRKKGKWREAAAAAGLSSVDAKMLNQAATNHYDASCAAYTQLSAAAAAEVLGSLIQDSYEILHTFRSAKRARAQLDFDDLIYAARDLLRDHEDVRRALGARFAHVLVDEFQDTDPLQSEIFWRLCGDPHPTETGWNHFSIRPGALFLVGDPKQAIYRFRGADVAAYLRARDAVVAQAPENLLSISTNFRSCSSILAFVNDRFQPVLSAPHQPGFTSLDAFRPDEYGPCVAALDVTVPSVNGKAGSDDQRSAEAGAIGELCARLIGNQMVIDRENGERRPCRPGDIALLAPTGTDLWLYEEALELRGVPVSTQAGKGVFRRQEIQDLIALTRTLADSRDTLALGALLRGPLVGLSEEILLDVVAGLPRDSDNLARIPSLSLNINPESVTNPLAREVIEKLQSLRRSMNSTTPHHLLSQAFDALSVRSILRHRYDRQAERALANVDLFLSLSVPYAVRGLRAFSEAVTAAWHDQTQAVEGRPDAEQDAVVLYTMHAAKGLEWPVVIPINTMTSVRSAEDAVVDRQTGTFYCSILGVAPEGHQAARDAEKLELARERARLWYVASTRAKQLLILPRPNVPAGNGSWTSVLDLSLEKLPTFDFSQSVQRTDISLSGSGNQQTRELFEVEAATVAASALKLKWSTPSVNADERGALVWEIPTTQVSDADDIFGPDHADRLQGSRERGSILHKLMEEILNGEISSEEKQVTTRASQLIDSLGCTTFDSSTHLSPSELAACVSRTLALPEIASLLPRLVAEFSVYASGVEGIYETAISGVVDAIAFGNFGQPETVIDWKSDVKIDRRRLVEYVSQVRTYLKVTGSRRGLIVFMTSGEIVALDSTVPLAM